MCLPEEARVPEDLSARRDLRLLSFRDIEPTDRELASVEFLVPPYGSQCEVAAAIPHMERLAVIQTLTSGVDWLPPALPPGVVVCNARTVHSAAVAEWIVAAILTNLKRFELFRRRQADHRWELRSVEALAGRTVMVLGYGHIGQAVARRLAPFDVELIAVARTAREGVLPVDDGLSRLGEVDVLVLLLPLTDKTRGLVDAGFLRRLKAGALIVNAARGAIVDTPALVSELEGGRIRAVLDVTDPEPLPEDHPLWTAPNVTITPHVAAETPDYESRAYDFVWKQLRRYMAGEPLQNVTL